MDNASAPVSKADLVELLAGFKAEFKAELKGELKSDFADLLTTVRATWPGWL
jgi:hypothetical protein